MHEHDFHTLLWHKNTPVAHCDTGVFSLLFQSQTSFTTSCNYRHTYSERLTRYRFNLKRASPLLATRLLWLLSGREPLFQSQTSFTTSCDPSSIAQKATVIIDRGFLLLRFYGFIKCLASVRKTFIKPFRPICRIVLV